jgi:hypothetical protein
MKDIPETEFTPVIANNEQVYDAYPELFEKITISNTPIYLEKPNPRNEETFMKEDRFFLLPLGIVSLTTADLEELWEIDKSNKIIFEELNKVAEKLNRKTINKEESSLLQSITIEDREYGVKYYLYSDINSNSEVLNMLEKKVLSWRGIPGR